MLDIQQSRFYARILIIKLNSTLLFAFQFEYRIQIQHSTFESESTIHFFFDLVYRNARSNQNSNFICQIFDIRYLKK